MWIDGRALAKHLARQALPGVLTGAAIGAVIALLSWFAGC